MLQEPGMRREQSIDEIVGGIKKIEIITNLVYFFNQFNRDSKGKMKTYASSGEPLLLADLSMTRSCTTGGGSIGRRSAIQYKKGGVTIVS